MSKRIVVYSAEKEEQARNLIFRVLQFVVVVDMA